jgi:hypothetical protein
MAHPWFKSFVEWRLTDVMVASDAELERAATACERLTVLFGILVVIGLLLEVIVAAWGDPFLDRWGAVGTDLLVAIGVFGEILFGLKGAARQRELQRRSNIKLSEATDRAAAATQKAEEAQLARVKLEVQLAPRMLTQEQYVALQSLEGQVAAVNITATSDYEANRFAAQIAQALSDAGIVVKLCPNRVGLVWSEIYVVMPMPVEEYRKVPLYVALKAAGLSVGCGDRRQVPMIDLPPEVPVIMVGEKKGLSYPSIPHAFNQSSRTAARKE